MGCTSEMRVRSLLVVAVVSVRCRRSGCRAWRASERRLDRKGSMLELAAFQRNVLGMYLSRIDHRASQPAAFCVIEPGHAADGREEEAL